MAFVYDAVDKDIGNHLREKNKNPRHKKNHHQWLKEFGRQQVHDQITKNCNGDEDVQRHK